MATWYKPWTWGKEDESSETSIENYSALDWEHPAGWHELQPNALGISCAMKPDGTYYMFHMEGVGVEMHMMKQDSGGWAIYRDHQIIEQNVTNPAEAHRLILEQFDLMLPNSPGYHGSAQCTPGDPSCNYTEGESGRSTHYFPADDYPRSNAGMSF